MHPRAKLLPEDTEGEVRAIEVMDYVVGTIHMQGFARIFVADNFNASGEAEREAVRQRGREIAGQGFAVMDAALQGREYAVGSFTIADAALFYVEFWADKVGLELPPNCRAHYQRMLGRSAVQRVLKEEGYRV